MLRKTDSSFNMCYVKSAPSQINQSEAKIAALLSEINAGFLIANNHNLFPLRVENELDMLSLKIGELETTGKFSLIQDRELKSSFNKIHSLIERAKQLHLLWGKSKTEIDNQQTMNCQRIDDRYSLKSVSLISQITRQIALVLSDLIHLLSNFTKSIYFRSMGTIHQHRLSSAQRRLDKVYKNMKHLREKQEKTAKKHHKVQLHRAGANYPDKFLKQEIDQAHDHRDKKILDCKLHKAQVGFAKQMHSWELNRDRIDELIFDTRARISGHIRLSYRSLSLYTLNALDRAEEQCFRTQRSLDEGRLDLNNRKLAKDQQRLVRKRAKNRFYQPKLASANRQFDDAAQALFDTKNLICDLKDALREIGLEPEKWPI